MKLGVRDVASLLNVSEKTVYRWIKQGFLPAYRVHEQYRFNRAELLEWATSKRLNVSADIFAEPESDQVNLPSLLEALRAGGIHYRVGGKTASEVLRCAIDLVPLPEEVDRGFLLKVLLARESLGSTAVGNGIAIPHVRNPIVLHVPRPMISLCFLEHPVEFGALDGRPVHTLFTMICPTVRPHLHLLSRLAYALRDASFAETVSRQASREEIMAAASMVEQRMSAAARTTNGSSNP